jgi:hypothetical protein
VFGVERRVVLRFEFLGDGLQFLPVGTARAERVVDLQDAVVGHRREFGGPSEVPRDLRSSLPLGDLGLFLQGLGSDDEFLAVYLPGDDLFEGDL